MVLHYRRASLLVALGLAASPALGAPPATGQTADTCARQLVAIGKALIAYQRDRRELPPHLSDLHPQYVRNRKLFLCPADTPPVDLAFEDGPRDPGLPVSYLYEMSLARNPPITLLGPLPAGDITWREAKQAQRIYFGARVPVARCWHHMHEADLGPGPAREPFVLSLTLTGQVYRSGASWEFDPGTLPSVLACLDRDLGGDPERFHQRWRTEDISWYFSRLDKVLPEHRARLRGMAEKLAARARTAGGPLASGFWKAAGSLYRAAGDKARAIAAYETGFRLPGQPGPAYLLAELYRELGQHDRAIAFLKEILSRDPQNILYLEQLANAYEAAGQRAKALKLRLKPDPGDYLVSLPAPDFALEDATGREIRLSDLRGKVVLLSFWASAGAPSRAEALHLEAMYRKYRDQGLVVLGLNNEEDAEAARAFAGKSVTYPILLEAGPVFKRYGVRALPSLYLVGRDGKIVRRYTGFAAGIAKVLEGDTRKLLAARSPS